VYLDGPVVTVLPLQWQCSEVISEDPPLCNMSASFVPPRSGTFNLTVAFVGHSLNAMPCDEILAFDHVVAVMPACTDVSVLTQGMWQRSQSDCEFPPRGLRGGGNGDGQHGDEEYDMVLQWVPYGECCPVWHHPRAIVNCLTSRNFTELLLVGDDVSGMAMLTALVEQITGRQPDHSLPLREDSGLGLTSYTIPNTGRISLVEVAHARSNSKVDKAPLWSGVVDRLCLVMDALECNRARGVVVVSLGLWAAASLNNSVDLTMLHQAIDASCPNMAMILVLGEPRLTGSTAAEAGLPVVSAALSSQVVQITDSHNVLVVDATSLFNAGLNTAWGTDHAPRPSQANPTWVVSVAMQFVWTAICMARGDDATPISSKLRPLRLADVTTLVSELGAATPGSFITARDPGSDQTGGVLDLDLIRQLQGRKDEDIQSTVSECVGEHELRHMFSDYEVEAIRDCNPHDNFKYRSVPYRFVHTSGSLLSQPQPPELQKRVHVRGAPWDRLVAFDLTDVTVVCPDQPQYTHFVHEGKVTCLHVINSLFSWQRAIPCC